MWYRWCYCWKFVDYVWALFCGWELSSLFLFQFYSSRVLTVKKTFYEKPRQLYEIMINKRGLQKIKLMNSVFHQGFNKFFTFLNLNSYILIIITLFNSLIVNVEEILCVKYFACYMQITVMGRFFFVSFHIAYCSYSVQHRPNRNVC